MLYIQNVDGANVNIIVVANLVLEPAEVYLLPGAVLPLRLSQIRQGRIEPISLPSAQYYVEADDGSIVSVVDESVRALQRGITNVRLRDRNMKNPDVSHAPFVTVHVVYPHRMVLTLLPERSWATVLLRQHTIQVSILVLTAMLLR